MPSRIGGFDLNLLDGIVLFFDPLQHGSFICILTVERRDVALFLCSSKEKELVQAAVPVVSIGARARITLFGL